MRRRFATLLMLLAAACGKKADPLPPLPRGPATIVQLEGWQDGNRLVFRVPLPTQTAGGGPLAGIDEVELTGHGLWTGSLRHLVSRPQDLAPGGTLVDSILIPDSERPERTPGEPVAWTARARSGTHWSAASTPVVLAPRPLEQGPVVFQIEAAGSSLRLVLAARDPDPTLQALGHPRGSVVYRRREGEAEPLAPHALVLDPQFVFEDTQLEEGCWIYRVAALLDGDRYRGPRGAEIEVAVRDDEPPPVPQDLEMFREEKRVRLRWTPSDATDLAGYVVERARPCGAAFAELARTSTASHDDAPVGAEDRLCYRVRAVDRNGNRSAPGTSVEAPPF